MIFGFPVRSRDDLTEIKVLFLLAPTMQIYMIENDISKVDDGER